MGDALKYKKSFVVVNIVFHLGVGGVGKELIDIVIKEKGLMGCKCSVPWKVVKTLDPNVISAVVSGDGPFVSELWISARYRSQWLLITVHTIWIIFGKKLFGRQGHVLEHYIAL